MGFSGDSAGKKLPRGDPGAAPPARQLPRGRGEAVLGGVGAGAGPVTACGFPLSPIEDAPSLGAVFMLLLSPVKYLRALSHCGGEFYNLRKKEDSGLEKV